MLEHRIEHRRQLFGVLAGMMRREVRCAHRKYIQ